MINIINRRKITALFTVTALAFLTISPIPTAIAARNNLSGIKIVLDPGHGGRDPGAIGPSGLQEKTVALSVARYLRNYLKHEKAEVIMTRDSDRFIPLKRRAQIANKVNANRFISVHLNASLNRSANKTETYFHKRAAAKTAVSVQKRMYKQIGSTNNGTHLAGFAVIRHTKMPGILTESSFISNPREEARLKNPSYRRKMAKAIFDGIKDVYEIRRRKSAKTKSKAVKAIEVQAEKVVKPKTTPVKTVAQSNKDKSLLVKTVETFFGKILPSVDSTKSADKESQSTQKDTNIEIEHSTAFPFLETVKKEGSLTKFKAPIVSEPDSHPVVVKNTSEKAIRPEIKLYDSEGRKISEVNPMLEKDKDFEFHPSNLSQEKDFAGSMEIAAPEAQIETQNTATITP